MKISDSNLVSADGQKIESTDPMIVTDRSKERQKEEAAYVPVIIKRNDQVVKHPDDTLEQAVHEGLEQTGRAFTSLLLSSISAGLILSFCAMSVAFAHGLFSVAAYGSLNRLSMALVYPIGFIICIMSGTQLFTEHTALAAYPYLDKKCSLLQLVRLWAIVLFGNMIGTACGSMMIYLAIPITGNEQSYVDIAHHVLHFPWSQIFISAILAGWLMSLGGWLVLSTPTSLSQIICIYFVTFLIGIGGFHHSIAGSAEVFIALLIAPDTSIFLIVNFLSAAVIGNIIGGSFFVAALNYAHIRKTQEIDA